MRCVSAEGKLPMIGLVVRPTILTFWSVLRDMPFSLCASCHEGSPDTFQIRRARLFDPGSKYFIQLI